MKPIALVLAALFLGTGAGVGGYALFAGGGSTTTLVRQVTVTRSQPTASKASALTVGDIYQQSYRGVVEITVTSNDSSSPFPSGRTQQAEGSGFVYDTAGHIVTNQHVVDGSTSISVRFWNGATYKAHVVGSDASTDVAVIKVDAPASALEPLVFGDSSTVAVGDGVVAIGSPFGLEETVTSGIVSALHRQMTAPNNFTIDDSIQTDAAINHGNSGGPLLDMQGNVIGVAAQIESDSGGNDGVGFAVPSNTVKSVAEQLISSGKVDHAYLGVSIEQVQGGAGIALVRSGTPAAAAGLQAGDVVTAINGAKIRSTADLTSTIDSKHPGDSITITFKRNGKTRTANVTLATRPQ